MINHESAAASVRIAIDPGPAAADRLAIHRHASGMRTDDHLIRLDTQRLRHKVDHLDSGGWPE